MDVIFIQTTSIEPIGLLFPGEDHVSHSQHSLDACSSLCRVEASWASLHPLACLLVSSLLTNIWAVILVRLMSMASDITRRHNFTYLWLLESFHPFFNVPSVSGSCFVVEAIVRNLFKKKKVQLTTCMINKVFSPHLSMPLKYTD